ncbi:RagB/SusD family nutrient uptake outer membrane protein [Arachidicoccus ginsenosidivorans]|uniref:RagB/SusD family nutrient uptake outer membrane protein n=2 Tax=Arachidicoccus ginsenosidivorans TaxID=496057 RepID=A0A5B8VK75_9BACT|nr:RagB/SusD family nutrient uptake outer membrane protein [Arachidicoccus ginsenosidivorans]
MKSLYKNTLYLIIIALATCFVSCKKWLDMPNPSAFDSQTTFATVSAAEMAVLGAYAKTFNRDIYCRLGDGNDASISSEGIGGSKWLLSNFEYSSALVPSDTYNSMYSGIEYSNVCISHLKEMKGKDEAEQKKINMLLGECYAIRAMSYFNLVRYWGDVPYRTIPVAADTSMYSSRVSRDTIYDGCIADLQKAVELLPWYSEGMISTPERFSKNSAYGILARVALYAAGYSLRWDLNTYAAGSVKLSKRADAGKIKQLYQIASDAADKVIKQGENALLPSFETVFRNLVQGKYDNETMLEYGQYGNDVNGGGIGYTNGMFTNSSSIYKKALPLIAAIPTLWFDYRPGDQRRDVSIANYSVTADNERQLNPYGNNRIGKFRATWMLDNGAAVNKRNINWPWLRYSDVLLMYAEAQNELYDGPTSEAKEALTEVRTRAFGGDKSKIGAIPSNYADFKSALIEERKLELAFEGLRRTDLVRWGVLYDTITAARQNVLDMANKTGRYANIDVYRAYQLKKATDFNDPVVAVPYIGYKAKPSETVIDSLTAAGYTLLDMFTGAPAAGAGDFPLESTAPWVTGLFEGAKKNKMEIMPLSDGMIDDNPGLQGEQMPSY